MQARATPRMYFCVEVVRKLFADKPLKTIRRKIEKRKEKRERKRCLKLSGVRGGFWQSSAEKWEGQRNYSLKNSLHKDTNSCFSIRKDQRIEVRAKSFALHNPFAPNFFVTWVSCEHGLWDTGGPGTSPAGKCVNLRWLKPQSFRDWHQNCTRKYRPKHSTCVLINELASLDGKKKTYGRKTLELVSRDAKTFGKKIAVFTVPICARELLVGQSREGEGGWEGWGGRGSSSRGNSLMLCFLSFFPYSAYEKFNQVSSFCESERASHRIFQKAVQVKAGSECPKKIAAEFDVDEY